MNIQKNALNWFEIPVADFQRAKKFYSAVLDYDMQSYQVAENELGLFPMENGVVGGAIVKGYGYTPSKTGTLVYLNAGEDLTPALLRIEPSGGKILQNKTLISEDIGYYALFIDSEGNKAALHSMA
jgi:predicted enzyme related to lactoylglutathione lyase